MKNMLKEIAELRVCTGECESVDECQQRLLDDAETFKKLYRTRTCKFTPYFHCMLSKSPTDGKYQSIESNQDKILVRELSAT